MSAHVGGIPIEEFVMSMVGMAGAGLVLVRGWALSLVRRRQVPSVRQRARPGWEVEVHEQRPPTEGGIFHHVDDVVLRARRRTEASVRSAEDRRGTR